MKPTNHLDFLDGIRGGAALWVLLAHCMIWGGRYIIPVPDPKIAVDIFMVVSGYLMFYLACQREFVEPPGKWDTIAKFYTRRFFRIAPLYFLVLCVVFLIGGSFIGGYRQLQAANPRQWIGTYYSQVQIHYSPVNFLMHATFAFGLFPAYASSTGLPDWSIGLEMQFYAVFPLWLFLFRRLRPITAALLILGTGVV